MQVAMALHGFRTVQNNLGSKHVEFKVVVSTARHTFQAWRSVADFERLAKVTGLYEGVGMKQAAGKFNKFRDFRRFHNFFLNSNLDLQLLQFSHLEIFIKELLFSIDPLSFFSSLVGFADNDRWCLRCSMPCECGCVPVRTRFGSLLTDLRFCGVASFSSQ